MEIIQTPIADLLIIKPRFFEDSRGFFAETFNRKNFAAKGIQVDFCQDNLSRSSMGVIRGLHYQLNPHGQSKLVTVLEGMVWDVAVDLRKDSPTFGQWYGVELSAENKLQFFIPKGFAHGFSVLSENALFSYKCDDFYTPEAERGILYNDPFLNIDWKLDASHAVVSSKDIANPLFREAEMNF
jgi:dTDP-4-dehydrorhamnose 3,5-epimerase